MVIKGGSRGSGGNLAGHLLRTDTNERAELLDLKGVSSVRLPEALAEMEAVAAGTRCRKSLYHASINTGPGEELTLEQKAAAVARLELALGLEGHARAVVEHRKEGREHLHVVWSRIDVDTMRATHDGHNYRKHEQVARELEREFGHNRVQGAHHERDSQSRPPRTPSSGEVQQATRTKRDLPGVTAELTGLWRATDTGPGFGAALEGAGYVLAQGDRRGYVVIDPAGGVHSLAKRIEGVKTRDINERLAGIELANLPTAEQARAMQREQAERQPRPQAPETARREAEATPAPQTPLRAVEPAQPSRDRREGPDFQQQFADSAEYRRERAETTRANDNRAATPKQPAAGKKAGRAIGRATGLLGTGLGKAAGGLLGILGGFLGAAAGVTEAATRSTPPARPAPGRSSRRAPTPPRQAEAPRPPSILDEIERERAVKPGPEPSRPRERDNDRSRFEALRPAMRFLGAAAPDQYSIGWAIQARLRLMAYAAETGEYVLTELEHLNHVITGAYLMAGLTLTGRQRMDEPA